MNFLPLPNRRTITATRPDGDLVKTVSALFVKEAECAYEPSHDAMAGMANRIRFHHDRLLSQNGYAINAAGRRTSRRSTSRGKTFTDEFGYDPDTLRRLSGCPDVERDLRPTLSRWVSY